MPAQFLWVNEICNDLIAGRWNSFDRLSARKKEIVFDEFDSQRIRFEMLAVKNNALGASTGPMKLAARNERIQLMMLKRM